MPVAPCFLPGFQTVSCGTGSVASSFETRPNGRSSSDNGEANRIQSPTTACSPVDVVFELINHELLITDFAFDKIAY